MEEARRKIRSSSLAAFFAILVIVLMFGFQTMSFILDWWTVGGALSTPESASRGMGLLSDALLIALAVYVAFVFLRINREETPFFPALPRRIKAAAVLLFLALTVPKWLYWSIVSFQLGRPAFTIVDEGVIFAFMLAAAVFCLGRIVEYGCLVQDENFEII